VSGCLFSLLRLPVSSVHTSVCPTFCQFSVSLSVQSRPCACNSIRLPFSSWHILLNLSLCLFRLYLTNAVPLLSIPQSPILSSPVRYYSISLQQFLCLPLDLLNCLLPFIFLAVLHVPGHESRIFGFAHVIPCRQSLHWVGDRQWLQIDGASIASLASTVLEEAEIKIN
jgi:hypothetical protein